MLLSSPLLFGRREFLKIISGAALVGALGWRPLQALAVQESQLEKIVNAYIQKLYQTGRISRDEQAAWSVYDFTSRQKLVSINENKPLQAASMIKPFLAQAYFYRHQANSRLFPFNRGIRLKMEAMIRDSDNSASNFFINRVGQGYPVEQRPREVERLLKQQASDVFRDISINEFIPEGGRTYRNLASASDYSRFLKAMGENRLPFIHHIKYYMGLSNRDRIIDGTQNVPRNAELYHKTGTTAHLCGDMGMLVVKGRNKKNCCYTFVGLIQKQGRADDYGDWMKDRGNVIREMSNLVYNFMAERHQLLS